MGGSKYYYNLLSAAGAAANKLERKLAKGEKIDREELRRRIKRAEIINSELRPCKYCVHLSASKPLVGVCNRVCSFEHNEFESIKGIDRYGHEINS